MEHENFNMGVCHYKENTTDFQDPAKYLNFQLNWQVHKYHKAK